VGLVLGERLIEERIVRTQETLTIGQSASNHFSVPVEGLPKSFALFVKTKDGYALRFTNNMSGRISSAEGVRTLAQLKTSGAERAAQKWQLPLHERSQGKVSVRADDYWELPLSEKSRGKISVGPMTLLFQFVAAPPIAPAPALPASMQRTLVSRVEPRLALILACSVLVHFSVALWAYTRDQIFDRPAERIAHSFQVGQYLMPEPIVPVDEDPIADASAAGANSTEPIAVEARREIVPRKHREVSPRRDVDTASGGDDINIAETIQKSAIISALTGKEGKGALFAEMNNTDQGASLDSSIEHIRGSETATLSDAPPRHRESTEAKLGTGDRVGVNGPGPAPRLEVKTEDSVARFDPAEPLSISDLDPEDIIKRIRGKYLAGIKRCHQRALKFDAGAQGKVAIRLTVGPTGRVTNAVAKGFNSEVDACITGQAASWRFSAPKDEGERTSADFEVPLILKPGG
jgi:hypothetical protein